MIGSLSKTEEAVIKKLSKEIKFALRNNLILLKLFGSKARGDFKRDSDIDILVVVKNKDVNLYSKLYDILFKRDPDYKFKISLIIYSEYEYKQNLRLKSKFIENIK